MTTHPSRRSTWLFAAAACVAAAGCGRTPSASFRPNLVAAAPVVTPDEDAEGPWREWADKRHRQVATILEALYGTPDAPVVLPETGLDVTKIRRAAGPVRSDIAGRKNGLYREHCAHCHGITGDGMGPTAAFLNPYPRDYRPGKFKFKSTWRDARPTHGDLVKILHDGIVGTSMPSFALLAPADVDALAEYVTYLSMRGETELALYAYIQEELDAKDELPVTREFLVDEILVPVATRWQEATTKQFPVAAVPAGVDFSGAEPRDEAAKAARAASLARGRELFLGTGGCVKCHGPTALGDGQANDYDDWNKVVVTDREQVVKGLEAAREVSTAGMSPEELAVHKARIEWLEARALVLDGDALRPRTIPPRNLRLGLYRGGRRPLDLYRRLYTGINGAPMPGVGPSAPGGKGTVPDEDIWHIVNYVLSLPYEADGALGADRTMASKDRF